MPIPSEVKKYEEQINLDLFHDMIDFITRTAGATGTQYQMLRVRCPFLHFDSDKSDFQEKYGFLYLGELLERYEERFGMTIQDLRAIALALGYTKDIVTDEMFVGNQYNSFLQKVRRLSKDDLYLTGALCLLSEGQNDAADTIQQLYRYAYTKTEEVVFVCGIFPSFEDAFPKLKAHLLVFLGKGRTMPVLGNTRALNWMIGRIQPLLKSSRAKDMLLFRSLYALPTSHVKAGSRHHNVLLEHGYTHLEIAYANAMTIQHRTVRGVLQYHSIVTEKVVVSLFATVLGCETALPEHVYTQLSKLYRDHAKFKIRCYGQERLVDALEENEVRIRTAETFVWFSEHTSIDHTVFRGFDIMDPHWDLLAREMEPTKYLQLFEMELHDAMDAESIWAHIRRYDTLTGTHYLDIYWNKQNGAQFSLLIEKGILDLWQAFQNSLDSNGEKQKHEMLSRIRFYLRGMDTIYAYRFYEQFLPCYGFEGLRRYFGGMEDFTDSLVHMSHYSKDATITIRLFQDYLTQEMRLQLLAWLDEYFFMWEPVRYLKFILAVLQYKEIGTLLDSKTLRSLFDLVMDDSELVKDCRSVLKQRYLSAEELQSEAEAKKAAEFERQRQKQLERIQYLRDDYEQKTDGSISSVLGYLKQYRPYQEEYDLSAHIAREHLDSLLIQVRHQLVPAEGSALLILCAHLVKRDVMTYEEARRHIANTTTKEAA